jgi:hypothetical protein
MISRCLSLNFTKAWCLRSSFRRIFLTADFFQKRTYSNTYRKTAQKKYVRRPQAREERGLLVVLTTVHYWQKLPNTVWSINLGLRCTMQVWTLRRQRWECSPPPPSPPRQWRRQGNQTYFSRAVLNRYEIGGWVFEKKSFTSSAQV